MTQDALSKLIDLLDRRTSLVAAVSGSTLSRCGACGMLVPDRLLAEHCRSYGDDVHVVTEVMGS